MVIDILYPQVLSFKRMYHFPLYLMRSLKAYVAIYHDSGNEAFYTSLIRN